MASSTLQTIICRACGEAKPASAAHFHRDRSKRTGFRGTCKACSRARSRGPATGLRGIRGDGQATAGEPSAALAPLDVPAPDGSPQWMQGVLQALVARMVEHPGDRDLQSVARAISQCATASRGFLDWATVDAELRTIRARVNVMEDERMRGRSWPTVADFVGKPHPDADPDDADEPN